MQTPSILPLEEQAYLSALLTQPHRCYHNISHVNDCLAELYKMLNANVATQYEWELTYAIWYHDAIYNPYAIATVNEYQSAELFIEYQIKHGKSSKFINDEVAYAIRATAHHIGTQEFKDTSPYNSNEAEIAKYMLDIDLAGLGQSSQVFAQNSYAITQEYPKTAPMDIVKGRLAFFTLLNQRPSFYYTDYFKTAYDKQSKENVTNEMTTLQEAINRNDASYYFDAVAEAMEW